MDMGCCASVSVEITASVLRSKYGHCSKRPLGRTVTVALNRPIRRGDPAGGISRDKIKDWKKRSNYNRLKQNKVQIAINEETKQRKIK